MAIKIGTLAVTTLTVSAARVAYGESVTVQCTFKNTASSKLQRLLVWMTPHMDVEGSEVSGAETADDFAALVYDAENTEYSPDRSAYIPVKCSVKKNKTLSYSWVYTPSYEGSGTQQRMVHPVLHIMYSNSTSWSNPVYGTISFDGDSAEVPVVEILDRWYNPELVCTGVRAARDGDMPTTINPSDEGGLLIGSIRLLTAGNVQPPSGFTGYVDYSRKSPAYTEREEHDNTWVQSLWYRPNAAGTGYIGGIEGLDIYPSETTEEPEPGLVPHNFYETGCSHTFTIWVGDDYEGKPFTFTVDDVEANVHLSGTGKGVAFGKFSSSTDGNPMFECEYPAHLFGGVAEGGCGTYSTTKEILCGKWIDEKPIYAKSFSYHVDGKTSTENKTLMDAATYAALGIETLVRIEGISKQYNGVINNIPAWYSSSNFRTLYVSDAGALILRHQESSTSNYNDVVVTLYYTKQEVQGNESGD